MAINMSDTLKYCVYIYVKRNMIVDLENEYG